MSRAMISPLAIALVFIATATAFAEEIALFNGRDLEGWTLDTRVERDGQPITKEDVFLVQNGVLICRGGLSLGTLRHEGTFEADYALSLQWRWGPNIASGADIVIHSAEEQDEVGRRKEIHVSLSVDDAGGIVYKATEPYKPDIATDREFFVDAQRDRQTDGEFEKDMGQWNHLLIICREQKITVLVNGNPVNQVTDAPRSQGAIGLGVAPVPIFYRDVKVVRPLTAAHARAEKAAEPLAAAWAKIEARKKAEELRREQQRLAQEQREQARKERELAARDSALQSLRNAVAADDGPEVVPELTAQALPYPRDARDLKFNATFGMIDFKSGSSLQALAAFYLRELARRGWVESEDDATLEEDSIELTFHAAGAEFELDLDESSDYVDVSIDTDGVDFEGTNDPASLAVLGIPQPRKALLLQKEIPIPEDAQRLSFDDDSCMFYHTMKVEEAFAHFGNLIRRKGYRESRRPIISSSRNYTEFKRRNVELSVNIFSDAVGSRIILEYGDGKKDPVLPPLPEVALSNPSSPVAGGTGGIASGTTPIDVSRNRGSATVNLNGERYVFSHVAAFQSQSDIEDGDTTSIVFSKRPIPFGQMQQKLASDDYFSFIDVSSFEAPVYLIVEVGSSSSISLSVPGTGLFSGLKNPLEGTQVAEGRIRGKLNYTDSEDENRDFSFTATVDAAVMTPDTALAGGGVAAVSAGEGEFVDIAPPMPDEAEDFSRTGTNFSKTYTATVRQSVGRIAAFYRDALTSGEWQEIDAPSASGSGEVLRFRNSVGTMTVRLAPKGSQTEISITKQDQNLAREQGVLPEPGKGRLILANAHNVGVVYTIGKRDYRVRAGRGGEDLKDALNYSVQPGKYEIVIKIPGERPKIERIQLGAGTTWAIIALPTGGYMPMQLY